MVHFVGVFDIVVTKYDRKTRKEVLENPKLVFLVNSDRTKVITLLVST
ncbi:MAG: hypothetical protein MJ119_08185 [Lachnospiraceae bacterium]|nr:hypothetical protein [Lachnospiraceae bacterium]